MAPAKVLFAVSDTGFGHRSAARAIESALVARLGPAVETSILDVYREVAAPLLRRSPELYTTASRHGRAVFDLLFDLTDTAGSRRVLGTTLERIATRRIHGLLDELRPDVVVVCNPLYMGQIFAAARQRSVHPFALATVVTDPVRVHQSWLARAVDMHFLVHAPTSGLIAEAFPARRIAFPAHPGVTVGGPSRAEARLQLGLEPHRPVALLSGGGSGSGRARRWAELLRLLNADPTIQVLVAPGTNRAIVDLVSQPAFSRVRLLDPSQPLTLPMRASTAVLSKAGPATIFEAAAIGVPLLLFDEVGRQEEGNIALAEHLGVGTALHWPYVSQWLHELEHRPLAPRPDLASGADMVSAWVAERVGRRAAAQRAGETAA